MAQSSYAHGQGEEITKIFSTRSAQRDGAFIIPFILPRSRILDIGSGPGSITCDFANIASEGEVIGVDASPEAVEKGQNLAKTRDLSNVVFQTGDITKGLPFADGEFDIVFCHQLLNHLSDPVQALREMKRLAKPGGIVAAREILEVMWHPGTEKLKSINFWHFAAIRKPEIQGSCVAENLSSYTQQAGFSPDKSFFNISGQMFTTEVQREFAVKATRAILGPQGSVRANAIKAGAVAEDLDEALSDLTAWLNDSTAWMTGLSAELIYHK